MNLRHSVRSRLAEHQVFLSMARRKYPRHVLDPAATQLVIDGFTRSAATFALIGFQLAQNDHVRVAHHLHAPAHLIGAARAGVPALVTVREPDPTILSAMAREPDVSARQWLRSYERFYRRIRPYRDRFVVGGFDQVTKALGGVIDRVNGRFGTSFARFKHTEQSVAEVFWLIDVRAAAPPWEDEIGQFLSGLISADEFRDVLEKRLAEQPLPDLPEHRVQRPSQERARQQEDLRARYLDPRLAELRARAETAYMAFVATPDGHGGTEPSGPADQSGHRIDL